MKKALTIFIILFIAQAVLHAQVKNSYGDDVSTLDGIMKAYYDVITVKKGEKVIFARDSFLHASNAIMGITRKGDDGKMQLKMISLRQFHDESDIYLEKEGFFEKEISRRVEKFGSIYQVWSTYETRNSANSPLLERGINSIQLQFDGTRFWIISWIAEDETKQQPIPTKYLINKK